MVSNRTVFLGIDPGSGREAMTYVALDAEKRLLAIGGGKIEDVLAYAAGQAEALAAVNYFYRPSREPPSAEIQQRLFPEFGDDLFGRLRKEAAERLETGIGESGLGLAEKDSRSGRKRSDLLVQQLQGLGYHRFPAEEEKRQWLRFSAQAAFLSLCSGRLFEGRSLEGRLQRQLVLFEEKLPIKDPMDFFEEVTRRRLLLGRLAYEMLYAPGELNALAGAYTAWLTVFDEQRVSQEADDREVIWYLPLPPAPTEN
ncbi:MAG: hypothetical protein ACK4SN_08950 [Bellilinea sp.]